MTRTGLSSPIQSSTHSGNSVLCPRSALSMKRFIRAPHKSCGNHIARITSSAVFSHSQGQTQKSERATGQSALPSRTDVASRASQVRKVPGADSCQREQMRGPNPTSEHSTFCGFRSKRGLIVDQLQQIVGANRLDENSKIMRGDRLGYVRPCIAR
jgi:hypothetical protein